VFCTLRANAHQRGPWPGNEKVWHVCRFGISLGADGRGRAERGAGCRGRSADGGLLCDQSARIGNGGAAAALRCDSSHVHATPLCAAAFHPAHVPRDTFRRGVQCSLPPGCRARKHSGCLGGRLPVARLCRTLQSLRSLLALPSRRSLAGCLCSGHDRDAWMQQRCSARHGLFAQLRHRSGGAGNCWIKHDRGFCRVHVLFALPRLAFVRSYGA
jgi:hypothetical protein